MNEYDLLISNKININNINIKNTNKNIELYNNETLYNSKEKNLENKLTNTIKKAKYIK